MKFEDVKIDEMLLYKGHIAFKQKADQVFVPSLGTNGFLNVFKDEEVETSDTCESYNKVQNAKK